ncbi:hypothetical protein [Castellaniella defragrans]|uniref:Uncharacterized protein n=1 Tax=Castellaniella defragrans TaxID=75697 RepID=A0A7W9TR65_CASDE|nr:hypothetical protein [Castellaniella defragrans]MBB6085344.1 hypothetical protein [Castellaniella defragrans]
MCLPAPTAAWGWPAFQLVRALGACSIAIAGSRGKVIGGKSVLHALIAGSSLIHHD